MTKIACIGLLLLSCCCSLWALELQISDPGRGMYIQAEPDLYWLTTTSGYTTKIYDENLELICTTSLPQADVSIIGAGRDFDDDDNIELLYSWVDMNSYQVHVFCRDIATGQYEFSYTDENYYAFTFYSAGERTVLVNQYMGTDYQQCYIYKSGVQHTGNTSSNIDSGFIQNLNRYPSPFLHNTTISFDLVEQSLVTVCIYNIKGQKVKTFSQQRSLPAGSHQIIWDGCNDKGTRLPSGQYFFMVSSQGQTEFQKTIFLK